MASALTPCTDSSQDTCTSETSTGHTPDSSPSVNMGALKTNASSMGGNFTSSLPQTSASHGTGLNNQSVSNMELLQKRRSSSRSIKRKKFDDELVESSFFKSERRSGSGSAAGAGSGTSNVTASASRVPLPAGVIGIAGPNTVDLFPTTNLNTSTDISVKDTLTPAIAEKKKPPKSTPKRLKKSKTAQSVLTKDLGRWKPTDDLALIISVQRTNDLEAVHRGVKFSCRFTLQEIQERWYALLYDQAISKVALSAIKQLHPDSISQVQSKALFSSDEEKILSTVMSTSQPTLETFQELLPKHPDVFLATRTAKSLLSHWNLMKQYNLLPDQIVQPLPKGDQLSNFSDAEDMLEDNELMETRDEALEHELAVMDRKSKLEIRKLENEIPKWQVLVDTITGVSPPDFDNQTLAVLRGRLVRYLMRSKEITIGRNTKVSKVDVDLSLEGPAWKISRQQGTIKLKSSGEFFVFNEGKRSIYVDGKPALPGSKYKLNSNSVIEFSGLKFIFQINQELVNAIRQEVAKTAA